jgi:hypothetical protein
MSAARKRKISTKERVVETLAKVEAALEENRVAREENVAVYRDFAKEVKIESVRPLRKMEA